MNLYALHRDGAPLLIDVPHAGTFVPEEIRGQFNPVARGLPDTDWFVDELYAFAPELGITLMTATHSRYVADLNRPPDDAPLYSSGSTSVVPLHTFDGEAIYPRENLPGDAAVANRKDRYWRPYHEVLHRELDRIRAKHGHAVLLDGHSIRSRVPALFEGTLPDFNLGSNRGESAAAELVDRAMAVLEEDPDHSAVLDGRFTGGFITRHYGRPGMGMHALQLEVSQAVYMGEAPPQRHPEAMQRLGRLLERLVGTLVDWKP